VLPTRLARKRDAIIADMLTNGIEARPVFYPMHRMPPYKQYVASGQNYNVSELISDGGISLPSGVTMDESDIEKVCDVLIRLMNKHAD
jgi:perosamine synthetase